MSKDNNNNNGYDIENTYTTVQGWMVTKLGLSGNKLLTYAIIYGFTQHGKFAYCTQDYIAAWCGIARENVNKIIKYLEEKKYIKKILVEEQGAKKKYWYKAIIPGQDTNDEEDEELAKAMAAVQKKSKKKSTSDKTSHVNESTSDESSHANEVTSDKTSHATCDKTSHNNIIYNNNNYIYNKKARSAPKTLCEKKEKSKNQFNNFMQSNLSSQDIEQLEIDLLRQTDLKVRQMRLIN